MLLHLLNDGLILLLILLLARVVRLLRLLMLLRLLIAGREIGSLLRLLLGLLGPGVRDVITTGSGTTTLLLCLACGLLQFFLKFVK